MVSLGARPEDLHILVNAEATQKNWAEARLTGFDKLGGDPFTASDLFAEIRPRVVGGSAQAPQFNYLGKSTGEGDDLVFLRKN